jgi:hypothetical protein
MKSKLAIDTKDIRKQTLLKWFYALPMLLMLWLGFYLGTIVPQNVWWTLPFWITFGLAAIASCGFYVINIIKYPMG